MNNVLEAARIYASNFHGPARFLVRYRPRICPFHRLLDFVPPCARILDVGCGSALFLYLCHVLRSAVFTSGVDTSARAIAQAESAAAKSFPPHGYAFKICAVPEEWPMEEFDVVSMVDVLHHIPPGRLADFIDAGAARLRAGGILLIKEMLPVPLWAGMMNRLHDLVMARQWISYVALDCLVDMRLKQNFEKVHEEKRRMYWYAHVIVILRKKASLRLAGI